MSTSTTVRPASFLVDPIADNLRAAAEMLAAYPYRTVLDALDHLGVSPDGVFYDLINLSGAAACEAIKAELLALSWKAQGFVTGRRPSSVRSNEKALWMRPIAQLSGVRLMPSAARVLPLRPRRARRFPPTLRSIPTREAAGAPARAATRPSSPVPPAAPPAVPPAHPPRLGGLPFESLPPTQQARAAGVVLLVLRRRAGWAA